MQQFCKYSQSTESLTNTIFWIFKIFLEKWNFWLIVIADSKPCESKKWNSIKDTLFGIMKVILWVEIFIWKWKRWLIFWEFAEKYQSITALHNFYSTRNGVKLIFINLWTLLGFNSMKTLFCYSTLLNIIPWVTTHSKWLKLHKINNNTFPAITYKNGNLLAHLMNRTDINGLGEQNESLNLMDISKTFTSASKTFKTVWNFMWNNLEKSTLIWQNRKWEKSKLKTGW